MGRYRISRSFIAAILTGLAGPALAKGHGSDPAVTIISLIGIGILVFITWAIMSANEQRLDDPNDKRTVYLDELPSVAQLSGTGRWLIRIIRQSGYVERDVEVTGSGHDALRTAMATFRRAKIPAVNIQKNEADALSFSRMFHDHRGRNEGKKVGRIEIVRVN